MQTRFVWPGGKQAAVCLTFDDARISQVETGLDILNARGVKASFYVSPPGLTSRSAAWLKAAAAGHEIGNHTLSHPCAGNYAFSRKNALEDYTLERMEHEIDAASELIERVVGRRPVTFAYPCGEQFVGRGEGHRSYVPLVARRFLVGRAYDQGGHNDPLACDLARVWAVGADQKDAAGLVRLTETAIRQAGWLILVAHEVGGDDPLTIQADVLDEYCRWITRPESGLLVDTVEHVGHHVRNMKLG